MEVRDGFSGARWERPVHWTQEEMQTNGQKVGGDPWVTVIVITRMKLERSAGSHPPRRGGSRGYLPDPRGECSVAEAHFVCRSHPLLEDPSLQWAVIERNLGACLWF